MFYINLEPKKFFFFTLFQIQMLWIYFSIKKKYINIIMGQTAIQFEVCVSGDHSI